MDGDDEWLGGERHRRPPRGPKIEGGRAEERNQRKGEREGQPAEGGALEPDVVGEAAGEKEADERNFIQTEGRREHKRGAPKGQRDQQDDTRCDETGWDGACWLGERV